ncbi:MFS transporter [Dyadobacter beijingensis]|uniref:MFS transporter n=1 Tax=Dyadobacter beijingensis TaxID=365489 RepID=A0ABQ2IJ92_9BACT|nr:MFS transporter [Dyadobacter beijingensis]GGN13737.1 MFS transporter [Dyadobacter beijingensis]
MKKIVYILAFGAFGIITTEMGVIGIMPDIAKGLDVSIDTAGWLLTAFAITIALAGPITVLATSRVNRKWMMAAVLLTFVISNFASFFAPNFAVLMVARLIPAFFHPIFWSIAAVAAAKLVPGKDAPKAVGIVFAGVSIATVLGIPLSTYVNSLFGWRSSFILGGVINLAALILLSLFVPSMPSTLEKGGLNDQMVIFKNPGLWANIATVFIMMAGMYATYSYLATYLLDVTKMESKMVSGMLLLFGAAGIAGNWAAGKALSRNQVATTRWFLILLAVIHLLAYGAGTILGLMAILVILWGLVHSAGLLIANTRITSEAEEAPELASSLMVTFANAGLAVGTYLGGLVIVHAGVHSLVLLSAGLLITALLITLLKFRKRPNVTRAPDHFEMHSQ